MKISIRNQYNTKPTKGTLFYEVSQTIPDQGLTIKQILNRYAKGLPLGGVDPNSAIYDDEAEGIDPRKLDLVDIQEISEETLVKIANLQKQAQEKADQTLNIDQNGTENESTRSDQQ